MTRLDEIKKYLSENGDVDGQDATWLIYELESTLDLVDRIQKQLTDSSDLLAKVMDKL